MKMSFDANKINEIYPEAEDLMIEPMLIWKLPSGKETMFSDICASGDYFAEQKIDGAFYQFVKTENYSYLFGRTVSVKTGLLTEKSANVPHITNAFSSLPPRTILIGEIYVPGGTSKDTVSIMGCLPELAIKRQEKNPIHYYIHDIIYYDGVRLVETGAEKRYKILKRVWELHNLAQYDFLELAEAFDTDIENRLAYILANGGEGVVLRKKDAPYYPSKRPAWSTIKMKKNDTIDLVCMGFCDATMEYTGKLDLGTNYSGSDADQWPYWCVFKTPFSIGELSAPLEPAIPTLYEKVPIGDYTVIKGIEFSTRPVTKGYYYGWKTAMRVGAYDENGKLVEVGKVSSGLTDEDCEKMATHPEEYLNHVFQFNCMEINRKEHTLRHPALIGRRDDKNAKDCTIEGEFA